MAADISNSSAVVCSSFNDGNTALTWVTLVLGVLSLVAISFTYQRRRLCQDFCWKLPGIVQPINLLTHSADHTINVILFAALSGDILIALFQQHHSISQSINPYAATLIRTVLLPIVSVLEVCVKYFPLFAGVDSPIPLVGHVVALLYLPFLLAHLIYRDVAIVCVLEVLSLHQSSVLTALYVTARVPIYLAFLAVVIWFLLNAIRGCVMWHKLGFGTAMEKQQGTHRSYHYYRNCVEHLLRRRVEERLRIERSKLFYCLCPCLTSPRKLPLRFTGAMTMATICLYQICLLLSGVLFYSFSSIDQLLRGNKGAIIDWIRNALHYGNAEEAYNMMKEITQALLVVLPASPVISLLLCFLLMSHLAVSVYKNLLAASKGALHLSKGFSSFRLAASLRYAGYQLAFALTAFLTYTLVLWVLGLIGALLFFGFKYFPDWMFLILSYILIPVAWIAVVLGIQVLACKLVFLKPGGGKFIVISNKRIFQWFTYILFVYNAIVGLASALLRVLISASLGLLLMLRLDRVILMKGFEFFDIGHNAYKGFLHVEHAYNNPVVHVFVKLMAEVTTSSSSKGVTRGRLDFSPDQDLAYGVEESKVLTQEMTSRGTYGTASTPKMSAMKSRIMRNKWLVAYTLLRNPSIQPLTASQLQSQDCDEVEDSY